MKYHPNMEKTKSYILTHECLTFFVTWAVINKTEEKM